MQMVGRLLLIVLLLGQERANTATDDAQQNPSSLLWKYDRELGVWQKYNATGSSVAKPHDRFKNKLGNLDDTNVDVISSPLQNDGALTCKVAWGDDAANRAKGFDRHSVLSVLWGKSVFCVGTTGHVFERFWNEQAWVYVSHKTPMLAALTVTAHNGRLYTVSATGKLFERRRVGQELEWIDTSPPLSLRLAGPARSSPSQSLFFISATGELMECRKTVNKKGCGEWLHHGRPHNACLAAVADAGTMQRDTVYVVSTDGRLFDHSADARWTEYGRPKWTALSPMAGAVLNMPPRYLSLFLLTVWGEVVELRRTSTHPNDWRWIFHGSPADTAIASAPGGVINSRSLFVVGVNGCVYELYRTLFKWEWISHGYPDNQVLPSDGKAGARAAPTSSVALDNRHIFFLREDNKLAERFWDQQWFWAIHEFTFEE